MAYENFRPMVRSPWPVSGDRLREPGFQSPSMPFTGSPQQAGGDMKGGDMKGGEYSTTPGGQEGPVSGMMADLRMRQAKRRKKRMMDEDDGMPALDQEPEPQGSWSRPPMGGRPPMRRGLA